MEWIELERGGANSKSAGVQASTPVRYQSRRVKWSGAERLSESSRLEVQVEVGDVLGIAAMCARATGVQPKKRVKRNVAPQRISRNAARKRSSKNKGSHVVGTHPPVSQDRGRRPIGAVMPQNKGEGRGRL